jgi:hypothetical protein
VCRRVIARCDYHTTVLPTGIGSGWQQSTGLPYFSRSTHIRCLPSTDTHRPNALPGFRSVKYMRLL